MVLHSVQAAGDRQDPVEIGPGAAQRSWTKIKVAGASPGFLTQK